MPFEATQEKLRELLEGATQAIARGEPVAHTVMIAVLGVLKIVSQATDTELPEITGKVLAILSTVSDNTVPEVSQTMQRVRQLCNDIIALLNRGVTIDLRDLKANEWNLSGRIAITPNKETER